jgi:hypothetical protein
VEAAAREEIRFAAVIDGPLGRLLATATEFIRAIVEDEKGLAIGLEEREALRAKQVSPGIGHRMPPVDRISTYQTSPSALSLITS